MDGNLRVVSHDDNRLIPVVKKIMDTQQMSIEHVVPKQAPRVSAPAS